MEGGVRMIRPFAASDIAQVLRLWNGSVLSGEVVYKPLTEEGFHALFTASPHYSPEYCLVAEEDGKVIGFLHGITKKIFLPKETHESTPGYLTAIFVDPAHRRKGAGTALLKALMEAFSRAGKRTIACSGSNPVNLPWLVPGAGGHDHNNAPGVDLECAGYPFLIKNGFEDRYSEVAMYLNLKDYMEAPEVQPKREALRVQGIHTGRYDPATNCDFDRMCDRVGSEYWRQVLRDETASPHPRPILAALDGRYMVGFTGPVDRQESGRGWFTGICTDPEYERRGIATVLFNLLMQEFIACGATFSTLFTGRDNHAQRLYLRTGFRVVRRFAILSRVI